MPDTQARAKKAFGGRKSPRRSTATGSVDEYKAVLLELNSKVTEVCSDNELSSEQKTDLIRYASRQAGHPLDNNRIVQILLEHHSKSKYGSNLILINLNQGSQWFEHGERHIVEDLITKGAQHHWWFVGGSQDKLHRDAPEFGAEPRQGAFVPWLPFEQRPSEERLLHWP